MKKTSDQIIVQECDAGKRIDVFLSDNFPEYSRTYFSNLARTNNIFANSIPVKPSYLLKPGDIVSIEFKAIENNTPPRPEDIPLDIIYEDQDVIVLNKQPGIVVHPAAGNPEGTLVNALIKYFPPITKAVYDKESIISQNRPGLVHRLDKDTSGVLIVAKNTRAMRSLSKQIQNRSTTKIYRAICFGWPPNIEGEIISYLGRHPKNRKMIADIGPEKGREAISKYRILNYLTINGHKISLIEFNIKTGRTHQIRVHAASLNMPVMGDSVYGNKQSMKLSSSLKIERQLLHAFSLTITLPSESKSRTFEAPIPKDFMDLLKKSTIINVL